jgi:hypothetical protein
MVFACKSADVAYNTAKYHRAQDRQFDEQCLAAMDYAGELVEARAFQRALEGDVEPIVYMGVVVGHVRKFDSRLQVELLRAYRPSNFKTPGTQVNIGTKGDVFVLSEEQRHELQRINREWLEENSPKKAVEPNQALPISSRNEADVKSERSQSNDPRLTPIL